MSIIGAIFIKKIEYPLVLFIISLAVYLGYSEAIGYDILNWDSHQYINDNVCIQGLSLSNIACIFTKVYFLNWHPLTSLSYAVEYEFFGANPKIYHINNLLLHAINSFLIYLLAKKILNFRGLPIRQVFVGAIVAAGLFAIHPQHVESVVWIAERKGLLSTLFFLTSVLFYIHYVINGFQKKFFLLAFITFLMSLLSKPMAVTMPVLLVLIDIFPLGRIDHSKERGAVIRSIGVLLVEKTIFFIGSLVMAGIVIYAQSSGGAVASLEEMSMVNRCLNAIYSFFLYVKLWVLPLELSPFYTHPVFILKGEMASIILLVLAFVGVIVLSLYYLFKGKVVGIVALFFIVISLAPVIGILQVGSQSAADRYTYLPLIPLYLMAGYFFSSLFFGAKLVNKFVSATVGLIVIVFLIGITKYQVGVWRSEVSLWSYVNSDLILSDSDKLAEHSNIYKVVWLAQAYYNEGDYENALKYYLLVEQFAPFPTVWEYVRFARSYSYLGMDKYALQIYDYLLKYPDCCEQGLKDMVDADIAAINKKQNKHAVIE